MNAPLSSAAPPADGAHGHGLPPAHSAKINSHTQPTLPPTGDTPELMESASRRYPIDQATYERLKAQADAAPQRRDRGDQATLGTSSSPQCATLGSTSTGGWNPPDGGLAVGPTSVLTAANEALTVYDRLGFRLHSGVGEGRSRSSMSCARLDA